MLRSFRVENHKSIRDEQELTLLPAYDKARPVVPVAAVFGANASGKSNLLDALRWLQDAVLHSFGAWQPGAGVPRSPFRLDLRAEAKPSGYAVDLLLDGVRYTYGVIVDDHRVREEWLYTYPRNRRRVIFERDGDQVRLGSTVSDYRPRSELLAGLTRPNALLLSVAARSNQNETQAVYGWFRSGLYLTAEQRLALPQSFLRRLEPLAPGRDEIINLIRRADLGISDVELAEAVDEETLQEARTRFEEAQRQRLALDFELERLGHGDETAGREHELLRVENQRALALSREQQASVMLRVALSAREQPPSLLFRHGLRSVPFELADESAGTRTWLSLLSATLDVIDKGAVLVVDELDMSLHPLLTAPLVNLFRDREVNRHGAQLVFSTHDTTLLGEQTVARDEVWFVEKKPDTGATQIYPLTSFHPRKSENVEGRYLAGGYGGVPNVSEHTFLQVVRRLRAGDEAA